MIFRTLLQKEIKTPTSHNIRISAHKNRKEQSNSSNFLSDFAGVSLLTTGGGTGALNGVDVTTDLSSVMSDTELLGGITRSESCKQHDANKTRCNWRWQTLHPAAVASHCLCRHMSLSGINSHKAVPPTYHPPHWQMHFSVVNGQPQSAGSKLSTNRLAAIDCCLLATAVHGNVLF